MATPRIAQQARDSRMTALHASAFTIAVLSGACALAALVAGSPLEFGVALALSSAGWVAADFIEWSVEGQRAGRRSAWPAATIGLAYGPRRVVFVGGECSARSVRRAGTGSAASYFGANAPLR
jgi:hypothetical protein